jgi:peptide/nickel transport system permease protein
VEQPSLSTAPANAPGPKPASRLVETKPISYRRLLFLRYLQNRLAVLAAVVLIGMYTITLFCPFFAPYDPTARFLDAVAQPPQLPRFIDADGRVHLQPFVYGMKLVRDPQTLKRIYTVDSGKQLPLRLLVRGATYKLLLWKTDLHFFGAAQGNVFLLGTDTQGRDLFSRILFGGRVSTTVGLIGVTISLVLGIVIGMASGFLGGKVDVVVQRVIEVLMSYPTLPLWMALAVAVPKDWNSDRVFLLVTIVLSIVGWGGLARVVRGMTLALRNEDYVLAARMGGGGTRWILFRHMLPANLSYVIVSATLAVPGMILGETALSFLGLGIQPPMISWGVLLQDAQKITSLGEYPWVIAPTFFIVLTVLAFNFVGDGLRDAVDPHSRF